MQTAETKQNQLLIDFIARRCEEKSISCKSIIVTVFGDLVSQHGGWIWLGSLIKALEPLGFSERLIRTSVFRLVQDDWLKVEKQGRKSFYAFTQSASEQYAKAARRIYANSQDNKDNDWLVVIPSFVPESQMQVFKRQLRWLGFSSLTSGALAHPSISKEALNETLKSMYLQDKVIILQGKTIDENSEKNLKKLVEKKWEVNSLAQDYNGFINAFSDLNLSQINLKPYSHQSFLLRTLLIHEFRRILLKDYDLPKSMLDNNWVGEKAYQLTKMLYKKLAQSSSFYAVENFENQSGKFPQQAGQFNTRFSR